MGDNKSIDDHLSLEEFTYAVFERPNDKSNPSYKRIEEHLGYCRDCANGIEKTRETNPLYKMYRNLVPNHISEENFWKMMAGNTTRDSGNHSS